MSLIYPYPRINIAYNKLGRRVYRERDILIDVEFIVPRIKSTLSTIYDDKYEHKNLHFISTIIIIFIQRPKLGSFSFSWEFIRDG